MFADMSRISITIIDKLLLNNSQLRRNEYSSEIYTTSYVGIKVLKCLEILCFEFVDSIEFARLMPNLKD